MPHPFADIPELADPQAGGPMVRIPTQQDVPFTPRVRAIVDTPEFQRLSEISQLGLAARVYPGARHSRFEHALGVFHNSLRYLWQLGRDSRFAARIDPHQAEVLMVSALLHDLGHWPYCHPIEDLELEGLPPHEAFAAEFLSGDQELPRVLRDVWRIDPQEVLEILSPKTQTTELQLLRSILSGPIDIDKMDYLERDSLHAGVPYGRNFDRNRLIQALVVNEAGNGLAITSKGKTAAELMVFARYVMFSEVYWHHAVRAGTCMFARAFQQLAHHFDWRTLFRLSDSEMIRLLRDHAGQGPAGELLAGVFGPHRRLYKRVLELSPLQSPEVCQLIAGRPYREIVEINLRLIERLRHETGTEIGEFDLLIDAPPMRREVEFKIEVYFPKSQTYRTLQDVSPVVQALARTQFDNDVKRLRLYARPDLASRLAAQRLETSRLTEFLVTAAGG